MPHQTQQPTGLQALILCGPGVSLNTFTSNPKELPKALIPIANRPMVWYPLDWCYRMGVGDITLVTPEESEAPLQAALGANPALTSLPSPRPEILAPRDLTQTTGTAELLRLPEVQKAITTDFLILPCDWICELDGGAILQQWMTLNPPPLSSTHRGGLGIFYPTHGLEGISTKKDESDFLASVPISAPAVPPLQTSLRPHVEQIVISTPMDTLKDQLEEDKGVLRLRQSLLERHGRIKIKTRHRDAHVYVFPKWVKSFVAANEHLESITEDVVGWWAKAGWQRRLVAKLHLNKILAKTPISTEEGNGALENDETEIITSNLSSTKVLQPSRLDPPPFASRVSSKAPPQLASVTHIPPILAYIQPAPSASTAQPLMRRIDTSAQLLTVSLHLARKTPASHPLAHEHKIHPSAKLEQQSRVSEPDSLVGENVKLGFRANVKESVVGANCEIGRNVRLTRCLLMDGVVVGDGVQMTGCIVGRRAKIEGTKPEQGTAAAAPIGEKNQGAAAPADGQKQKRRKGDENGDEGRTKLTDCEIAPSFVVEAGTEAKGEKLMAFNTDDMDGFEDEDGEDDETRDDEVDD